VKTKTVMKIGMFVGSAYFLSVFLTMFAGNSISEIYMHIVTMLSGIYMVLFVIALPERKENTKQFYKILAITCASVCMVLTNISHWITLAAIQPLMENGISVPEYLQSGTWPSLIMAIDYLGWGLFMGLSFVCSAFFADPEAKLKTLLFLCGILCLIGFFGSLISPFIWLVAPMGYGVGALIIGIKVLLSKKLS